MLARALDSLTAQSLPADDYDILVIDNGSTDNTPDLAQDRAARQPNLHYLAEPKLGLSTARNTGLRHAHADLVAFMDDDAIASPGWLEEICHVFTDRHPQPGLVCGPVNAEWGAARPPWLKNYWLPFYSIVSWSSEARCLDADEWVVGANFAIPRALAIDCGGFDVALGRIGSTLLGDEELALTENIRRAGYEVFFDPAICVDHFIHAERLSKRWFYRRVFWGAVSASVRQRQKLPSKRERYRRAARSARGAFGYAWSRAQFSESEEERVLRYHQVAEKLGQTRGYLIGSARLL
jgi:glycosyltransferase involved in cell wall biosynthesis